ncbi:AbrB/MazE/SpoVT family DNA-binding domain-containing protein [Candidatus Roizmanbacteria bacterium]|nr:AbrB/MazE/SpoVT family DNA-binding domain-containing protein [Candidatus Roizmanbacteria bacterium]
MKSSQTDTQEEWVNILPKGLITIPKKIRETVGIKEGDVAKVKVRGKKIIIEPREEIDYRTFTKEEIEEWLEEDKLPPKLAKKTEKYWKDLP